MCLYFSLLGNFKNQIDALISSHMNSSEKSTFASRRREGGYVKEGLSNNVLKAQLILQILKRIKIIGNGH